MRGSGQVDRQLDGLTGWVAGQAEGFRYLLERWSCPGSSDQRRSLVVKRPPGNQVLHASSVIASAEGMIEVELVSGVDPVKV